MYNKAIKHDLRVPATRSVTKGSKRLSASQNTVPAPRRKNGDAVNRKQGVKGHLKADELKATGKSLHVPVYKPAEAVGSFGKSDVLHKLITSENRLGHSNTLEVELSPLHVKCSCGNVRRQAPVVAEPSSSASTSSSSSDGSESDDDESSSEQVGTGYDVASLIRLLIIQDNKGGQQRSANILRNLATCVTMDEGVTEVHLHQLLRLVTSSVACVREASLLALQQAGRVSEMARLLLESGAMGRVLMLLHAEDEGAVITAGCRFLEEITSHEHLKDIWLEEMVVTGLNVLIGVLSGKGQGQGGPSIQSQQAVAGLLSQLANHLQLGIMILDHGMDDIEVSFRKQPGIRESIIELITNLIRHNDHTAGGVLNYKFTSLVAVTLRDGPCSVQIKAMDFCRELCLYEAGVHALIKDTMLLTTCLQVLRSTHCRYVQRLGTATLDALLRGSTTGQLRVFFRQADRSFNEKNQVHVDPNRRRAKDVWIPLSRQTFEMDNGDQDRRGRKEHEEQLDKKMRSGVKEVVNLVVHVIHVEGKIQRDEKNNVTDVRFRPSQDDSSGLHEAVRCLKTLANMSEAVMSRNSVHRLLISCGALCVLDIFHAFTAAAFGFAQCATPDTEKQQRNPEALYLQASMKLWQGSAKRAESNAMVRELYDESKLSFLKSILELLLVLAEASCNRWSEGIISQLEKQVLDSHSWHDNHDDSDYDATQKPSKYRYIENVGQAFHDGDILRSKGVGERKSKVRFAWADNGKLSDNHVPESHPTIPGHRGQQSGMGHGTNVNNNNNKRSTGNRWTSPVKRNGSPEGDGSGDALEAVQKRQKSQLMVKKLLVKGGVCETVSSWVISGLEEIEDLASDVMLYMIQPEDPEEIHRFAAETSKQLNPAQKHQARAQEVADSLAQRDALLSKILSQMSVETADLVSDTLQVKSQDEVKGHEEVKSPDKGKGQRKRQKDDDSISVSTTSTTSSKLRNKQLVSAYKPLLKSDKPLAYQTSLALLDLIGKRLVKSLVDGSCQSSSQSKRRQLLILYDLVSNGDVVIHMTLASYGLVSYLMQYIQRNVQYSVDILLCLAILRNMMGDQRIKQLFRSEGGEKFLQRVVSATTGAVKLHAERFLSFLSQGTTGLIWS